MDANKLKILIEGTKQLNVLYVEDNEDIIISTLGILKTFFTNIESAINGADGLEKFKDNPNYYDLIISDINMPKMNGLEMIKEIKQINNEIPIVITTAHNDYTYLIKAIEMKVDRYLMKPLDIKQIIDVLSDISKMVSEKKMLAQLLEKEHQAALKAKEEEVIQKITNTYITPTAIFQKGKLVQSSESFLDLFDTKKKEELEKITIDDYTLFEKKKGYMSSFEDYDSENKEKNKVSISKKIGKRIYRIYKKDIDFNDAHADIYIFVNITQEEYLKMKIESYTTSLEKMVIKNQKSKIQDDKGLLGNSKKDDDRLTAKEFLQRIKKENLEEFQELDELDNDILYAIESFENGEFTKLIEISWLLKKYANMIYPIVEFENLYVAIYSLSELFTSLDFTTLNEAQQNKFFPYLETVRDGLKDWRKSIFIEQNAEDIHYLDTSLISATLQIEVLISDHEQDIEADESDLDFF